MNRPAGPNRSLQFACGQVILPGKARSDGPAI